MKHQDVERVLPIVSLGDKAPGILLLLATIIALLWANSRWSEAYFNALSAPVTAGIGGFVLQKPLLAWINDGLMAIFFFVVGLEIKREILVGELASIRQAALPILAAAGGVIAPASIYAMFNVGGPGASGWGIPMATDIAFALGVLALLGSRVPPGITIFLTALAIVDDIAAVLVIAIFYTASINANALLLAGACVLVLTLLNVRGVRWPLVYLAVGIVLWLAVLKSGVHATIAGVVLAMFIPARTRIFPDEYVVRTRRLLESFEKALKPGNHVLTSEDQQNALHGIEEASEDVQPPLHRLEHALYPWVTYFIMPVFALANAGVAFGGEASPSFASPVAIGVMLGLLIGKPLGIFGASWLAVRAGLADLSKGTSWGHINGAGWLGGIGFTMSLFVAGLAFSDPSLLATAKAGILAASTLAGITGFTLLARKK